MYVHIYILFNFSHYCVVYYSIKKYVQERKKEMFAKNTHKLL